MFATKFAAEYEGPKEELKVSGLGFKVRFRT